MYIPALRCVGGVSGVGVVGGVGGGVYSCLLMCRWWWCWRGCISLPCDVLVGLVVLEGALPCDVLVVLEGVYIPALCVLVVLVLLVVLEGVYIYLPCDVLVVLVVLEGRGGGGYTPAL